MLRLGLVLALLFAACGGGGVGSDVLPYLPGGPTALTYGQVVSVYANGSPIPANAPSWEGETPSEFTVSPPLPTGLRLDPTTGVITGTTARTLAPPQTYRVTARSASGAASVDLEITVGVLDTLADGFTAEVVAEGLSTPVRLVELPDGRLLFNELETGDTRVLHADGTLQAAPFAHTEVLAGGHRGLLGLVLHPEHGANGWVYLAATVPGDGGLEDRGIVTRYTAAETSPGVLEGTNETIVVDELPVAAINNGGDLAFDQVAPEPRLFVSVGDVDDPPRAQDVGGLAGRILRYTDEGLVPDDNPFAGDPTFCLGLRNTFAIATQPATGDLWGGDNGPAANDELNYLRAGRNFEWGGLPPGTPPSDVGIVVASWVDVIVPTALAWHDGAGWGSAFENDLFLTCYADEALRRFRLSGLAFLDVDAEEVFASFRPDGVANKPLDVEVAEDGSLYVSTFSAIYRIRKD